MPELDSIVWSYAFAAAAWGILGALMLVAGIRNHLVHRVRPIVWLLAAIGVVLSLQNVARVATSYLRTVGRIAEYLKLLDSGVWLWTNLIGGMLAVAFVIAVIVVYPQMRNTRDRRADDIKPGGTD